MIETAAIIAVIVALVEIVKGIGMASKFAPLLAIALGVIAAFFLAPELTTGLTVFSGIVYGLSAMGLYAGGRTVTGI